MPTKLSVLPLVAIAVSMSAPALAAESGFYLGGGAGQSTFKEDSSSINFDENATAWKVFAGYRIGALPILDFAGELTYRDFGHPDKAGAEFKAKGGDATGLAIVTLGPVDLFGRFGVGRYSVDTTISGASHDEDSNSEIFGVGAGFRIGHVNIRLEWERAQPHLVDHIDMYTLNAYWRF
jgi:outer membrane immunogenic protein